MSEENSSTKMLLAIGVPILLIFAVLVFYFSRGYGTVSYPAYQVATALYGASLAKSESRIDAVQDLLDNGNEKLDVTAITEKERKWLQAIIEDAKSARWETAAKDAKRIMESQNEPSD